MSDKFKPIGINPRMLRRLQSRGTRGEVIKCLAELIKNADDAYDRLETRNKKTSGIIETGYWRLRKQKGSSISGFYVRDYGSGMPLKKAVDAYGEEGYGADTSDDTRNGAIGVGGKDAFYGMEDCIIISVQDGKPIAIKIGLNGQGILGSQIHTDDEAKALISQINDMITPNCKPLSLEDNGTFAMFKIPETHAGKRSDTLQDQLTRYYTLRNIMEFDFRTVKMIEVATGQTYIIKRKSLDGEIIFEKRISISHGGETFDVDITIQKADHDLDHDKEFGDNLIIVDERGAVLDNTLFDYENEPAAGRIFGKIVIHKWKHLYRDIDQTVLTDNREGLDYKNHFNKQLRLQIIQILKPIIDTEKEKQGDNPKLTKNLDDNIKKAFSFINKIMQKDPHEGFDEADDMEIPPEGIAFEKGSLTLPPQRVRSVKLYVNPGKVPTNSVITLKLFGEGVTVTPKDSVITDTTYLPKKVPFVIVNIEGERINTKATLRAYYGDLQDELEILVVPEETFYPLTGFAFVPKSINLTKNRKKKIKLVLDTNLIKPGTVVEISAEDQRIKVFPEKLTVSHPPKLGKYLTEELIEVSCNISELSTRLIANTKTILNEDRQAICKISVHEKEPPKQFFKDYQLDKKGDKRQRSRFKDGIVYVHVNAPILENYFGKDQTKLDKNEADAVAMLADTVVQCVSKEWAKWRIDTDKEEILGDRETEIERVKNKLEYEFGAQLHQMIASGYVR